MHKNGRLEEERVTPIEAHSLVKIIELLLKIEHRYMLSNNGLCPCAAAHMCTIFSNGSIIPPGFKVDSISFLEIKKEANVWSCDNHVILQ